MNERNADIAELGVFEPLPVRSKASWLISYADLVTILLSFMILLLAVSGLNQAKFEILVSSLSGQSEGTLQQVQKRLDEIIQEKGLVGEVETRLDPDGLKVSFSNALLFPSGSDQLTERGLGVFAPIAEQLAGTLEPKFGLVIEGHTDDVPIQTAAFHSNWELSASRSIHVMNRLAAAGLDRRRMSVQGYADTRPADARPWAEGDASPELDGRRRESRRVVIRIDTLDPAGRRLLLGARDGWHAAETAEEGTQP